MIIIKSIDYTQLLSSLLHVYWVSNGVYKYNKMIVTINVN